MAGEDSAKLVLTDRTYRALLGVSSAMVEQATVKAVLHSLRGVLSSSCRLHGAHLYILSSERSFASGAATFEQAERQVIIDALNAASGKISGRGGAAERLGLKRTALQNKMRKLNVSRAEYSA